MDKHATIRAAAGDALGVDGRTVRVAERSAAGYPSNRLYDARLRDGQGRERHLIVKEFLKPDEFDKAPVREFEGLRMLAPLDIAPQPFLMRPHFNAARPLVVYEFMPGEMWDRRRPEPHELRQLAGVWLRLNELPVDDLWLSRGAETPLARQMAQHERMYREYAAWAEVHFAPGVRAAGLCLSALRARREVVEDLQAAAPLLCFCRADARFANVIARPDGRVGLVDWEDCGLRDPALDLGDVVMAPNQEDLLDWDGWQPLLQSYLERRGRHDAGLERRMELYLALFPLAWLGWLLSAGVARAREGRLQGWQIHEMAANEKLRRYLARARAWPALDFSEELALLAEVRFFPEA